MIIAWLRQADIFVILGSVIMLIVNIGGMINEMPRDIVRSVLIAESGGLRFPEDINIFNAPIKPQCDFIVSSPSDEDGFDRENHLISFSGMEGGYRTVL